MSHSSYTFIIPPLPISTLFPYTTLFRSLELLEDFLPGCVYRIGRRDFRTREPLIEAIPGVQTKLPEVDRKSTRLNSSHLVISYAVFCLKKKKKIYIINVDKNR